MGLSAVPTFAQRWHRATMAAGDQTVLVWEGSDGATRQWSYAEFGELAGDVAGFLASRGVQRKGWKISPESTMAFSQPQLSPACCSGSSNRSSFCLLPAYSPSA